MQVVKKETPMCEQPCPVSNRMMREVYNEKELHTTTMASMDVTESAREAQKKLNWHRNGIARFRKTSRSIDGRRHVG